MNNTTAPAITRLPFTLISLLITIAVSSSATAQMPVEYEAEYVARANGISATARRSLSALDAQSFRIVNRIKAEVLRKTVARIEQSSELKIQANEILPSSYSYALTGISSKSHAIFYNWDAGVAVSSEDEESWTLDLPGPTGDQLSHQLEMRRRLIEAPESPVGSAFEFAVIDGDEIEQHRYEIVAREVLATPLGALNTVKLQRIREGSSTRSTIIWLASDWQFLLARIEQQSGSGLNIKLELSAAQVGGEAVISLP